MNIMREISKYNFSSRNGNSIKYIVLHYTGNKGDTAKNNSTYFGGGNRNASAHYFVDDNYIYQVVEDSNAAWSVGDGKGAYGITNQNSISIEMCCDKNGNITEKTENNTIELVKSIQAKYNISNSNVVRHYDASRKTCPNWSNNNWSRWTSFKNKLNGSYQKEEEDYIVELFSESWYLNKNKDVAAAVKNGGYKTGYHHYIQNGKAEGRKPLPPIPTEYNEGDYLALNSDVADAIKRGDCISGVQHYLLYGYCENRKISKGESDAAVKKRVEELEIKMQEIKKIIG